MTCFWRHKWSYEAVRQVTYTITTMIGRLRPIAISEPRHEIQDRQYRTCTVCGVTEDTQVKEY